MKTMPDVQPLPWQDFCSDMPYGKVRHDEEIEVWREEPGYAQGRIRLCDMPPEMNVHGLLWRRVASDC